MKRIEDKILQYIISGRTSGSEGSEKELRKDPSFNSDEFDLFQKIWYAADRLKHYRKLPHDEAWQNVVREAGIQRTVHRNSTRRLVIWTSSAAAVMILGLVYFLSDPYVTHRALTDELYLLPDKSTVLLKAGAEIRHLKPAKFVAADIRNISLTGEGHFKVIRDTSKMFVVSNLLTRVDVLGTRFIYRAGTDFSESENIEGLVRFCTIDGRQEVLLKPGDKATFDGSTIEVTLHVEPAGTKNGKEKRGNKLTLADLIDILGDLYPAEIVFMPTVQYSPVVVQVNLGDTNLDTIIHNLEEDSLVQIEAEKSSLGYKISNLTARPSGLDVDYTYEMYRSGIEWKK